MTPAVAVYAAPRFLKTELRDFLRGAREVCELVDAAYVGGDLDDHEEFTVATTALGQTANPVYRGGATPGETVCVTGTLGRSAAALRLFNDDPERANALFRFEPRVAAGQAEASGCGLVVESAQLPVHDAVREVANDDGDERELAVHFGEDFELVFTTPDPAAARRASPTPIACVGEVVDDGVRLDDEPLPDRGYTH